MKTMTAVKWIAKGALLLTGCSGHFELKRGPGFTQEQWQVIEARALEWLSVGADLGSVHVLRAPDDQGHLGVHRERDNRSDIIWLRVDVPDEQFSRAALHEFGHLAGAEHHEGTGIMTRGFDHFDNVPCITPEDLRLIGLNGEGTCQQ